MRDECMSNGRPERRIRSRGEKGWAMNKKKKRKGKEREKERGGRERR